MSFRVSKSWPNLHFCVNYPFKLHQEQTDPIIITDAFYAGHSIKIFVQVLMFSNTTGVVWKSKECSF